MPAGEDAGKEISEITLGTLINEVKALKKKCNNLVRDVEYLKIRCETHEKLSNRGREEILKIHNILFEAVDTNYDGESFELTK